jgi:hypothetical protein
MASVKGGELLAERFKCIAVRGQLSTFENHRDSIPIFTHTHVHMHTYTHIYIIGTSCERYALLCAPLAPMVGSGVPGLPA